MVRVAVDEELELVVERGAESAYSVDVVHEGETVTTYDTNSAPWTVPGRLAIGNVVAKRLSERYERDAAREAVTDAIAARRDDLEAMAD